MQFQNQKLISYRAATPEETLERISRALKRLELGEEKILESPTSDRLHSARLTLPELRAGSNGKGVTPLQAKVSAYAEMVERLSILETGLEISPYRDVEINDAKLVKRLKTFAHVKGHRWSHQDCFKHVVAIEDLLGAVPLTKENFEYLKNESKLLRDWIPAFSIMEDKTVYIPPLFVRWLSSTNGLAAGNTPEEALIHAFCEIIERWALLHFLRSKDSYAPNVDLNTIDDDDIRSMLVFFEANDVEVVVKDLTQSGMFPVYAIITTNRSLSPNFVGYNTIKAGCHFDTKEALKRAFTERMQGTSFQDERHLGFVNPNETDVLLPLYLKGICPFNLDEFKSGEEVPFRYTTYSTTGEAFERMKTITSSLNTDMVVVDHTHRQIKFPVLRLIMPKISDFIGWWEPSRINLNFLGNILPKEEEYEKKLFSFLETF